MLKLALEATGVSRAVIRLGARRSFCDPENCPEPEKHNSHPEKHNSAVLQPEKRISREEVDDS